MKRRTWKAPCTRDVADGKAFNIEIAGISGDRQKRATKEKSVSRGGRYLKMDDSPEHYGQASEPSV